MDDEITMRRPATSAEWKANDWRGPGARANGTGSRHERVASPERVRVLNWPDGYQKDEFGNTFFQLGTPQFRGGVNPELIPRPDLPPQENRTRGVRMAQLAAIAFFQR